MNCRKPIFIHYVHDMDRARRFYQTVFAVSPSSSSKDWTTLNFESFELALHILSPSNHEEGPLPHAGLNLEVDGIEDMQAIIERNGGAMTELREATRTVPDRVATFRGYRRQRIRASSTRWARGVTPNKRMQPTSQTVIKFACANLPPVWCAADAGC